MYGRRPQTQMAVIGTDPWGRPMVGEVVRVNPGGALGRPLPPVYLPPAGQPPVLVPPAGPALSPSWRDGQIAPGVEGAQEGMVPLPLIPQAGNGIFTAALTQIIFQGSLQKPYRAECLLMQVARTGTTAAPVFVQGQVFVGTDLQQGDILPILLEPLGAPGSFGTRLTLMQAPPGVLLRIITSLTGALTSPDTVGVGMMFTGRIIH